MCLYIFVYINIILKINLNTGYADTDADLCIRIMSLCCSLTFDITISNVILSYDATSSYL